MLVYLFAVAGGILIVGMFPVLPPYWVLLFLLPPAVLIFRFPLLKIPVAAGLGMAWGVFYGHGIMANLLPEELVGQDLVVSGRVVDLPVNDDRRQRVILEVEQARLPAEGALPLADFPAKIQISWYAKDPVAVRSGERWQWQVRLKRPRGFINPGGFDYQVWLMRRDIGGTGYVRESGYTQRQGPAGGWDIGAHRQMLRDWLLASTDGTQRPVLLALLIGDRSLMDTEQWRRMQLTGVNHLVAISGLHIGFIAVAGFFVGCLPRPPDHGSPVPM